MFRERLLHEFSPYGALSSEQLDQLERHHSLLQRWNQKINLTRILDLDDVIKFHYCECLFLGMSLPKGPLHIVDIGSGPGFPGIPTAVIRPDCVVHLVESHRRKAVFLREASRELSNVQVINSSADVVVPVYDWAVSRAVRPRDVASLGLAPNIALLATEDEAAKMTGPCTLQRLPWGKSRVIVTFHVEHDKIVKRGQSHCH